MTTARTLVTAALRKINAASANSPPTDEDIDLALETLNEVIDSKSDSLLNTHVIRPVRFQLTPGQLLYNLGPTGDWQTERPMRIEKARLMLAPTILYGEFTSNVQTGSPPLSVTFYPELV